MTPKKAFLTVAAALAVGLAPAPDTRPSAWAAENLIVPDGPKAGTKWDPSQTPYLVDILDKLSATSPATRVVVRKSAQVGFTQVGLAWLGYVVDVVPARTMMVMPTIAVGQDFNREKLSPSIDASRVLRTKVRSQKSRSSSGSTALNKRFAGGSIVITGANSAADLRSKTVRFAFADEIDEWPKDLDGQGDPMAMLVARQIAYDASGDWKRLEGSTPTIKSESRLDAAFDAGDQQYWNVPCPHCGHRQKLHFFPDSNDHGGLRFNKEYPYHAWYACEACGAAIEEHHKQAAIRAGTWVAENPGAGRHPSYHIDSLISLLVSWDRIAEEFLKAKDDPAKLKAFYNLWLGLAWEERGEAPDWDRLFARRADYPARTIPVGGMVFTLAVDVQGDGLFYEAVAWGEGRTSWTIDAGFLVGDTADPNGAAWRALTEVYERRYPDAYGQTWPVDLAGVDAQYNTDAVWAWVRTRPNALALRGVPGWYAPPIGTPGKLDVTWSGKKRRRGLMVWPVGTWPLKGALYAFLRKPGLRDGAEEDPPGYCHFGMFLDVRYFQQLTAEYIKEKQQKGRVVREWEASGPNHYHDCRIYNMALADRLGVPRMTSDEWARLAKSRGMTGVPTDLIGRMTVPAIPQQSKPETKSNPQSNPQHMAVPRVRGEGATVVRGGTTRVR